MSALEIQEEALQSANKIIDCIYTDGSFIPGTKGGGWAILVIYKDGSQLEIAGSLPNENSLRMELHAVIQALQLIKSTRQTHRLRIFVDCLIIVDRCNNRRAMLRSRRSNLDSASADLWGMIYELRSENVPSFRTNYEIDKESYQKEACFESSSFKSGH